MTTDIFKLKNDTSYDVKDHANKYTISINSNNTAKCKVQAILARDEKDEFLDTAIDLKDGSPVSYSFISSDTPPQRYVL